MEEQHEYRLEVDAASGFHAAIEAVYAPELRKFNNPDIPKLEDGSFNPEYSLENHLVYSLSSYRRNKDIAPIIIGLIRRTSSVIISYRKARGLAYEFIAYKKNAGKIAVPLYERSLLQWEQVIVHISLITELLNHFNEMALARPMKDVLVYRTGDNSPWERACTIANTIKHPEKIRKHQGTKVQTTLPIWLASDRIRSFDADLTYFECHKLITDLMDHVHRLATLVRFSV
jgi:hypothetical protein